MTLSHLRAITQIPDPIHRVISLTCFEREIVDSEHFQRLHFILQNSTTYAAFPSNKNSRFSHSLGVMHISGRLFISALSNAAPKDLERFLDDASALIHKSSIIASANAVTKLKYAWKQTISGVSEFRHRPFLKHHGKNGATTLEIETEFPRNINGEHRKLPSGFLVDTLWQAIRICGLVHDIGHLPMSHSFEGAIDKFCEHKFHSENGRSPTKEQLAKERQKYTSNDEFSKAFDEFHPILKLLYEDDAKVDKLKIAFDNFPLHEKRSLYILFKLFSEEKIVTDPNISEYRILVYRLAFLVLLSSVRKDRSGMGLPLTDPSDALTDDTNNDAFRFMKLIVAGSIDADRMDYTLRDSFSSGLDMGDFGLEDIIHSAILFRDNREKTFQLGFYYRSLGAIERFFRHRYEGYKHIIYHRTSSRTEVCLQNALASLFIFFEQRKSHAITQRFIDANFINFKSGIIEICPMTRGDKALGKSNSVPFIDDAILRHLLEQTLFDLKTVDEKDEHFITLKAKAKPLLGIILRREFENIFDPFKDTSVTSRAKQALEKTEQQALVKTEVEEEAFERARRQIATRASVRAECKELFLRTLQSGLDDACSIYISEQLPKIYNHRFAFAKGEEIYLVYKELDEEGGAIVKRLIDVSPTIRRMEQIFVDEFRINCFFVSNSIKSNESLIEKADTLIDRALENAMPRASTTR